MVLDSIFFYFFFHSLRSQGRPEDFFPTRVVEAAQEKIQKSTKKGFQACFGHPFLSGPVFIFGLIFSVLLFALERTNRLVGKDAMGERSCASPCRVALELNSQACAFCSSKKQIASKGRKRKMKKWFQIPKFSLRAQLPQASKYGQEFWPWAVSLRRPTAKIKEAFGIPLEIFRGPIFFRAEFLFFF